MAKETNPIIHKKIELDSKGIEERIEGFQGYEAIVLNGDNVYLAIEAENSGRMSAYIIKGEIDSNKNLINIFPNSLKEIPLSINLKNMAIETLLIVNNRVVAIYEANGKNVNVQPVVMSFDLDLQNHELSPFPNIEYRITDATRIHNNTFWGVNYLYPGEKELLNPADENLFQKDGEGLTQSNNQAVERLVHFQITDDGIRIIKETPVHIKLSEDNESRNWEGIVKYDSLGFLLITDKFPKTILAYLPYSNRKTDLFVFEIAEKYGFRNALDVEVITPQFSFAQDFSQYGIAAAVDDSGWVYINKQGEKIIRPHIVDNGPDYFSSGLSRFRSNNKFGYFDEKGRVIIKPQFDYARPFADSMAAVCQGCQLLKKGDHTEIINGNWGFINSKGELIIPYIYDKVSDFIEGKAKVEKNGNSTFVSRET